MEWFSFLSDITNTLEPYIILIVLSIWLLYFFKRKKHLLSRVSIFESIAGFFIVAIIIILYKINFITYNTYEASVFLSAVGVLWGTQGFLWGFIFYIIPIEKFLKVDRKKK